MASPFNVFRKHQKVILVAAGVLCMIVFVIGDVAFSLLGPSRGGGGGTGEYDYNDVAVRWNGGELTLGEVQNLAARRAILRGFLEGALQEGMRRTGSSTSFPSVRMVMQLDPNSEPFPPQQEAVFRHLAAEAARDAGMVVSNDAINQYLSQLTQGQVSGQELRALASNLQTPMGRRVGMTYLFDALREEMLANAYLDSYARAVATLTPQERWEEWRKFNDRIVIESVAVPVGNFVDQVPDPSEEELHTFYEQYKNVAPTNVLVQPNTELPSPDPGFRIPRRVAVHYLEANYESLVDRIAAEVTEDEIREHYEANKDDYVKPTLGIDDPAEEPPISDLQTDPAVDSAAEQSAEPPKVDGEPESESAAPAESEDPEPQDTDAAPPAQDAPQSSHLFLPSDEPTRYVSLQDIPPLSEDPDNSDDAAQPAEPADAAEPAADPAPPSADGSAATELGPPADAATESAQPSEFSNPDGLPPSPDESSPVEYLPLEEVRDQIRRTIADDRVPQRLNTIVTQVRDELARAYREYEDRRLDAEALGEDPKTVAPPNIDFAALAEKHGLEARETPLLSQLELKDTQLGESIVQQVGLPYWYYAFDQQQLYQPASTVLIVSAFEQMLGRFNEYVAVKVDEKPAETPPLDEIRDEVVRTYKRIRARELAMEAAKEMAEKAKSAGGTLTDHLAGSEQYEAIESDPFTWYADSMGQSFHLGKPYGVEHPGPDFLNEVFSLAPGETSVVWNHDRSAAYVVRLDRHELSEDALRNLFLQEAPRSQVLQKAAQYHRQQYTQALLESIFQRANVQWEIPPDQPARNA